MKHPPPGDLVDATASANDTPASLSPCDALVPDHFKRAATTTASRAMAYLELSPR